MKRIIIAILMVFAMSITLSACGSSSSYVPKELATFNSIYKADNPSSNGSASVINITTAKLNADDKIMIEVGAPQAQEVVYAYSNFLAFDVIDASGNSVKIDKISINEGDHQTSEAIFTLQGSSFSNAKYVKLLPYKTSAGNPVIFELQK